MSKFFYNTLTINGITKICDDTIYIDTQRQVINYQWHKFQLVYIVEKFLKLSSKDPITGLELSKRDLCNLINTTISGCSTCIFTSDDVEMDKTMGLVPKKILDIISIDNIGGIPNKNPILDIYGLNLLVSSKIEYLYEDELPKRSESSHQFSHIKSKFHKKPLKMRRASWQMESSSRKQLALKTIADDNPFNYGRLSWYANSCFADSVLFLLLVPKTSDKQFSPFTINNFLNKNMLDAADIAAINHRKYLCKNNQTIDQSIKILNNIFTNFKNMHSQLNKNKIINAFLFLKNMDICREQLGRERYSDGGMHDSIEFLNHLLSIFKIDSSYFNEQHLYKSIDNTGDSYTSTLENMFINAVSNYNKAGKSNYDILETSTDNKPFIIKAVTYDELHSIYKTINVDDQISLKDIQNLLKHKAKKSVLDQLKGLRYDGLIDKIYPEEGNLGTVLLAKRAITINLSAFLNYKTESEFTDDNINIHIKNEGKYKISTIQGHRYLIRKDKSEPNIKISSLSKSNDKIIKIKKIIKHTIVKDAENLFFEIHRKGQIKKNIQGKGKSVHFMKIKLIPENSIKLISGKDIYLRGIVVYRPAHYISYFKFDDKWYLYNDYFNPDEQNDYIVEVGNYDNLLTVNKEEVCRNGIIYWYY